MDTSFKKDKDQRAGDKLSNTGSITGKPPKISTEDPVSASQTELEENIVNDDSPNSITSSIIGSTDISSLPIPDTGLRLVKDGSKHSLNLSDDDIDYFLEQEENDTQKPIKMDEDTKKEAKLRAKSKLRRENRSRTFKRSKSRNRMSGSPSRPLSAAQSPLLSARTPADDYSFVGDMSSRQARLSNNNTSPIKGKVLDSTNNSLAPLPKKPSLSPKPELKIQNESKSISASNIFDPTGMMTGFESLTTKLKSTLSSATNPFESFANTFSLSSSTSNSDARVLISTVQEKPNKTVITTSENMNSGNKTQPSIGIKTTVTSINANQTNITTTFSSTDLPEDDSIPIATDEQNAGFAAWLQALYSSVLYGSNNDAPVSLESKNRFSFVRGDVVFVPGILGTYLKDKNTNKREWLTIEKLMNMAPCELSSSLYSSKIDPYSSKLANDERIVVDEVFEKFGPINVCGKFVQEMEDLCKERNDVRLHKLGYDWRSDMTEVADRLLKKMVDIYESNGNKKITYIAHSLGGLLGMNIVNRRPDIFRGLVMVGSPMKPVPVVLWAFKKGLPILPNTSLFDRDFVFLMKSAYIFLPLDGKGLIDKNNNDIKIDYLDPQEWFKYGFVPPKYCDFLDKDDDEGIDSYSDSDVENNDKTTNKMDIDDNSSIRSCCSCCCETIEYNKYNSNKLHDIDNDEINLAKKWGVIPSIDNNNNNDYNINNSSSNIHNNNNKLEPSKNKDVSKFKNDNNLSKINIKPSQQQSQYTINKKTGKLELRPTRNQVIKHLTKVLDNVREFRLNLIHNPVREYPPIAVVTSRKIPTLNTFRATMTDYIEQSIQEESIKVEGDAITGLINNPFKATTTASIAAFFGVKLPQALSASSILGQTSTTVSNNSNTVTTSTTTTTASISSKNLEQTTLMTTTTTMASSNNSTTLSTDFINDNAIKLDDDDKNADSIIDDNYNKNDQSNLENMNIESSSHRYKCDKHQNIHYSKGRHCSKCRIEECNLRECNLKYNNEKDNSKNDNNKTYEEVLKSKNKHKWWKRVESTKPKKQIDILWPKEIVQGDGIVTHDMTKLPQGYKYTEISSSFGHVSIMNDIESIREALNKLDFTDF